MQKHRVETVKRLMQDKDHATALPLLDALIAERPEHAPLHWHRSTCLEALERPEDALISVQRVIALRPEFAQAWLRRAELSAGLQEAYPAYESDVRKALALDDSMAPAHRALALIHYRRDRPEEAQAALNKALALDPRDSEAYAIRASWAGHAAWSAMEGEETVSQCNGMKLSRRQIEQSAEDLRKALALAPDAVRHRLQLGRRLHELGRYDEAISEFDQLLATQPQDWPLRGVTLDMRRRSIGQGAGERCDLAATLERSSLDMGDGERRSVGDEMASSMLRLAARTLPRRWRASTTATWIRC